MAAPNAQPAAAQPAAAPSPDAVSTSLRPRLRPKSVESAAAPAAAAPAAAAPVDAVQSASAGGIALTMLRPRARPRVLAEQASFQPPDVDPPVAEQEPAPKGRGKKGQTADASPKGSVCGVPGIKGEKIAPITSKVKGCGLADGVRVTSVSGVRLSMAVTIDCPTAKALNAWVKDVAQPAYGGKLVELRIAGHYICRPRNNVRGAKVSEHGRGKAIDVSGFVLSTGKVEMVLGGFGKTMRTAHKRACGIFNTTLGPGSDGYHEDHLHFDTAPGRGPYCR